MRKAFGEYVRLPGSRFGGAAVLASRTSLWLGKDHIMYVLNQGYSEECKRFYYRNIQSIVLHQTRAGFVWNVVWGYLAVNSLALVALSLALGWPIGVALTFGLLTMFFSLFLLANWLRGPTCHTYLQTAVQTIRLYSLDRLPVALEAVGLIRARVDAEQGPLAASGTPLSADLGPVTAAPATAAPPPAAWKAVAVAVTAPLKHDRGRIHEALFVLLLAGLCHTCGRFFTGGTALYVLGVLLTIGTVAALVTAIIRQHGTDLPSGVKRLTYGTLAFLIVSTLVTSVHGIVFSLEHPHLSNNSILLSRALFDVSPTKSLFQLIHLLVAIGFDGIVGFLGLWQLHRFRRASAAPPPVASGEPPAA